MARQLLELGGRLQSAGKTAPAYRFYALPGGPPQRPGLVRVTEGGGAIELEVWSLPATRIGDLLRRIPAPLGLGMVSLAGILPLAIATRSSRAWIGGGLLALALVIGVALALALVTWWTS